MTRTALMLTVSSRRPAMLVPASVRPLVPVAVLTLGSVQLPQAARDVLFRNGTRALVTTGDTALPWAHVLVTGQSRVGAIAVEHLISTGRRTIGLLMPDDATTRALAVERATRAEAAATQAGDRLRHLPDAGVAAFSGDADLASSKSRTP